MIISFDEVYPLWCATERYLGEFDTHSAVCEFDTHSAYCECSHHLQFYTCVVWYWYMKVVLGFDRNITQCHWSPSPAVVIIHISSGQYPEHTVECVYEYCFVLFSQFEKFIGSINTFQFGAVLQMIFVILLPSLHYFEKWATTINSNHSHFSLSLSSIQCLSAVDSPDCHTDFCAVVRDYLLWSSLPLYQQLCHVRQARGSQWILWGTTLTALFSVWLERDRHLW